MARAGSTRVTPLARDNLAERMVAVAQRHGWRDRVAFRVGTRRWSHGQVHAGASAAATLLAGEGVEPGDRVAIAAPDGVEFVWAFLGAARLGAVAVPLDPDASAADHAHAVAEVGPAAAVCTRALAGRFSGVPGVLATEELPGRLASVPLRAVTPVTPDTPAYAQLTPGPGGRALAALHRHRDAEVYFQAFARRALAIRPADVLLSVSKLHDPYGLANSLLFPLLSGASAALHPGRAEPAETPAGAVAALLRRHRPSILLAPPSFLDRLGEWAQQADRPRSLRLAAVATDPAALADRSARTGPDSTGPEIARRLGCTVLSGLCSAAVGHVYVSGTPGAWREGTAGRPLPPYQVRVHTAEGAPCAPGEEGILWVRGPSVMLGYHDRPDATAQALDGDWLRTGLLATEDPDGFISCTGPAPHAPPRA